MKIATVVGARPQFVKMGPLSCLFKKKIAEIVIHTGQHYNHNLSSVFFKELGLAKPKYNLDINPKTASGPGTDVLQIAGMLEALEKVLIKEKPDIALTYGDTNSALACALASSKLNIPFAHVEAGVRGFDRTVPEEINRLIIDRLSTLLFCPTKSAVENLKNEGIKNGVFYTGDVMAEVLRDRIGDVPPAPYGAGYVLVTLHRQENADRKENLEEIVNALTGFKGRLIFSVHPRTRKNLKKFNLWKKIISRNSIVILEPQGYLNFLSLQKNAVKILTDSGGVQREAYLLKVPCLTLRKTTEWPETLENGWNRLVPCKKDLILRALGTSPGPGPHKSIFGNEKASKKIFRIIKDFADNISV
jgi:UDP-N-acetylglucosamine 2-epimerase (non-hydrolysing)